MKANRDFRKPLILIAAFAIALAICLVYLSRICLNSAHFRVRNILMRGGNPADFEHLKGRNIFSIDLKKQSRLILSEHIYYKKVRLIRVMPDQIYVDYVSRSPLAYIKLSRVYCIDDEMFLFPLPKEYMPFDLPVISGIEKKLFALKGSRVYNSPELRSALDLIKEAKSTKALAGFKLRKVDLSQSDMILVYISTDPAAASKPSVGYPRAGMIEVRFSQDKVREKVEVLSSVLSGATGKIENISYIDLRFNESVVKFK